MKRMLLNWLESLFLRLEHIASAGLNWVDRHYPESSIDELIEEIERAERHRFKSLHADNVVHLPRDWTRRAH